MGSEEKFAQWAALFVSSMDNAAAAADGERLSSSVAGVQYAGVTRAACELLQTVDAGGVPAFVTGNLKEIARENGVDATDCLTPNEIIEAIRRKAQEQASGEVGDTGCMVP